MQQKSYTEVPQKIQKVMISVPWGLLLLFQQNDLQKTRKSKRTYTNFNWLKNFKISRNVAQNHEKWCKKNELLMCIKINISSIILQNPWHAKNIHHRRSADPPPLASQKMGRSVHRTIRKCEKKVEAKKTEKHNYDNNIQNGGAPVFLKIEIVEEIWTQTGSQKNKKT